VDFDRRTLERLPQPLRQKFAEVEAILGRPVSITVDGTLEGWARGAANTDGSIRLAPSSIYDAAVIEEG
jgi:hypothetical protein